MTKTSHGRPVYKIRSFQRLPLRRYNMGCKILKRVAWPRPRPFQGRFLIGRVGLAMINQCTKFEVSRFTHCEGMNGGAKCTNWSSLGHLRVTQGHRQCRVVHGLGWPMGWVGWVEIFQFLVGWVGSTTEKVLKIWKDYVNAFKARLDVIWFHQAVKL